MKRRLSSRERWMVIVIGAILFLLANLAVVNTLRSGLAAKGLELQAKRSDRDALRLVLEEKQFWADRDAWLTKHQPKLENEDRAAVELWEEVQALARVHNVLLENSQLGVVENHLHRRSVAVSVETRSSWEALVLFLNELQQPERFTVLELVNLQIDSSDPTRMRGRFKIARWFAPLATK